SHGIWFGHIGEYLWFHDEKFCSLGCFLKFVENWYKRAEHSAHSDAGKSADLEAESNADNLSTSQAVA
ncbi:hypothetical protein, partial [Limosilactobacillus reuteri]|uniref:hypothetical protein n=1 Tax=Limosilactobacillus reuteri TaxID=1598 RepID=UPI00207CF67D